MIGPTAKIRHKVGWWAVAATVCVPAIVFLPGAKDPFGLPKLLVAESLGLLSVMILLFGAAKGANESLLHI